MDLKGSRDSGPGPGWRCIATLAALLFAASVVASCGLGDRIPADETERVLTEHLTGALPNLVPAADLHVFTDSIRDVTPSTKRAWGPFEAPFVIRSPDGFPRPDLMLPGSYGTRYHARVSFEFGPGEVVEYGPALADLMPRALERQIGSPEAELIAGLYRLKALADAWRSDHFGEAVTRLLMAEEEGDSAREVALDAVASTMDTTIPATLLETRAESMDPSLPATMEWGSVDPVGDGGAHLLWIRQAEVVGLTCVLPLTPFYRLDAESVSRSLWGDSAIMQALDDLSLTYKADLRASCRRDGRTLRLSAAQGDAFRLLEGELTAMHAPDP